MTNPYDLITDVIVESLPVMLHRHSHGCPQYISALDLYHRALSSISFSSTVLLCLLVNPTSVLALVAVTLFA